VYSLGIDAGGTYTDVVLLNDDSDMIIDSNKALTTYPDPLDGIKNAIEGIDQNNFKDIKIVSVSTTLSTNTILEGNGASVGLILIGDHGIKQELPTPYYAQLRGGHNHDGTQKEILDEYGIQKFVMKVKNRVSAFAISSYFSIRNPDHEKRAKSIVKEFSGHPVVCAHELSLDIGAFERATTAFFNAQLIPITEKFMETVELYIKSRGIDPKIFMLKCDGSVIGIKSALGKPIESIFSGPAGSLVGASFLSENETCAVIDVGGTSTDISVIQDGIPEISDDGAIVGGWKTRVKAIKMETSAMGGDSHVWIKDNTIQIGPRRVIPLSRAAEQYPDFLDMLRLNSMPSKLLTSSNIQPTTFYMRSGYSPLDLNDMEQATFDTIDDVPTSLRVLRRRLGNIYPSNKVLESLLQKRLIQPIGFTPTDALHLLGDYVGHNVEAAEVGAELLGSMCKKDSMKFAASVKQQFARNMASNIASFFLEGVPKEEVRKIFDMEIPMKFKVEIPIVLIGGPVVAYKKELEEIFDADIIIPKYSEVGNAAGALAAKGIRRVDFLLKPVSLISPGGITDVFSEFGRGRFLSYEDAVHYAKETGSMLVMKYMEDGSFDYGHVNIDIIKEETIPDGWVCPIQTNIRVIGVATRLIDNDINIRPCLKEIRILKHPPTEANK